MEFVANDDAMQRLIDGQGVERLIDGVSARVEHTAEDLVPRRTGRLQRSITHDVIRDAEGVVGRIYWDRRIAWYGHFVEFGTSHSAPQPFLRNALRKTT